MAETTTNPIQRLDVMTKDERLLLLFLETQAVDHCGMVVGAHMNADDFKTAKGWAKTGFIRFSRLLSNHLAGHCSHCVILSDEAWACAALARERRGRANINPATRESLEHFEGLGNA